MNYPELKTPRLTLRLPEPNQAKAALEYVESNRDHLSPTSPALPNNFFNSEFWEKRLSQSRQEFDHDGSSPDYLFIRGAWRTHGLTSLTNSTWTSRNEDTGIFK
jgi:RimJ/RimL family protein N-acetyltransferase